MVNAACFDAGMRRALPLLVLALGLGACSAGSRTDFAPVPPTAHAPAPPPAAVAAPPDGAAANLVIPARLVDGSYATPNRNVSAAAAAWHLRAAFNVAALNCNDPAIATAYNRFLNVHRRALAEAHRRAAAFHGAAFDPAMTRLYNYFAQPPVLARFCAAAGALAQEAAAWPVAGLSEAAGPALARIDQPFVDFYTRYDAWRAAATAPRPTGPRLAYQASIFAFDPTVTGGSETLAAR
jgi:hypothetical protein